MSIPSDNELFTNIIVIDPYTHYTVQLLYIYTEVCTLRAIFAHIQLVWCCWTTRVCDLFVFVHLLYHAAASESSHASLQCGERSPQTHTRANKQQPPRISRIISHRVYAWSRMDSIVPKGISHSHPQPPPTPSPRYYQATFQLCYV